MRTPPWATTGVVRRGEHGDEPFDRDHLARGASALGPSAAKAPS